MKRNINLIAIVFAVTSALVFSGCGGTTYVQNSRSIVHNGGTMIIDNVTNIRGVVRIGDDDVTNVERDAYEATYGENEVAFNSIIVFDESEFILESGTSDRYRDIKSAQDELKRRTKDINSFLKSKKRQMDIRRWQK